MAVAISVGCSKSARSFFFTINMCNFNFSNGDGSKLPSAPSPWQVYGRVFHIGLAGWPCTPSIPPNPEVIGDHRASIFTTFHHSFLSLSLTRTLMLATTRNYTFHTANIPLWAAPCVLWSSLRLFAVLQADRDGPCWTPKRLILNNDFQTPEVDILVFMLSILRCKGVQVVLVPSCLQLLLDAGEKEAYYIILLFFNQDRSGFIPTIWQSHLKLGNLHIFPGERTVICNTGGFLIATPPAVRWGFRYYMDVCL